MKDLLSIADKIFNEHKYLFREPFKKVVSVYLDTLVSLQHLCVPK